MKKYMAVILFLLALLASCEDEHSYHSCEVSSGEFRALQERVAAINQRTSIQSGDFLAIRRFTIPLGKTGSEVCDEHQGTCVGVTTTASDDSRDRFCGYTAPSCNSRVQAHPRCMVQANGAVSNFIIDRTEFRRAPHAPGNCGGVVTEMCLETPSHDYVVCAVGNQEILNPTADAGVIH